jgi:cytoskeletal protein CcmA (bactofilin family)
MKNIKERETMYDYNMEGIGKINGGEFGTVTVDGVGTCTEDLKAETIRVNGVFKCRGTLEAGFMQTDGTAEVNAYIRAKKMVVEGMLTVRGEGKIEAGEIECEGMIKAGEISADIINADGFINAREIVGDRIVIRSHSNRIAQFFTKRFSHIELIEATNIEIHGVVAKAVNGQNIVIGPNCIIDSVDCSGTLTVHDSSSIKTMTGDYTMKN